MKQLRVRYFDYEWARNLLTHWGRVTHICVGKLSIIGSHNGLSPGRRPSIIWTNAGILLIGPLGTNFSENWIGFEKFSIKEMYFKMSAKCRLFGLGLNELIGPLGTMTSQCFNNSTCDVTMGHTLGALINQNSALLLLPHDMKLITLGFLMEEISIFIH